MPFQLPLNADMGSLAQEHLGRLIDVHIHMCQSASEPLAQHNYLCPRDLASQEAVVKRPQARAGA